MLCPLCHSAGKSFFKTKNGKEFLQCDFCRSIFLHSRFYLSYEEEEKRYLKHQNDVNDAGYISFVEPVIQTIKNNQKSTSKGLDYGCGTGPVIATQLKTSGFSISLYDPFFKQNESIFNATYDFIICCEVMEHFYAPEKEFKKLALLLSPGGKLFCKTSLFKSDLDFGDWYYKNDPTHVFLYSEESLHFIEKKFNFSSLQIENEVIIFKK